MHSKKALSVRTPNDVRSTHVVYRMKVENVQRQDGDLRTFDV